jgi:phosphoserine phosphatase
MAMDKTDRVLGLAFLCQIAYGGLDSDKVAETVEDFFGEAVDGEGLASGGSSCTPFQHMLLSATLDRLSWHRGAGHLVVLLSASPAHITIPLGRVLGVDIVAAAPCPTVEMSSKEGGMAVEKEGRGRRKVFSRCMYGDTVRLLILIFRTGLKGFSQSIFQCSTTVSPLHRFPCLVPPPVCLLSQCLVGGNKTRLLSILTERYGIDLPSSYGYGDHVTDVELLETVGKAVVVCDHRGNGTMRGMAEERGWEVLQGHGKPDNGQSSTGGGDSGGDSMAEAPLAGEVGEKPGVWLGVRIILDAVGLVPFKGGPVPPPGPVTTTGPRPATTNDRSGETKIKSKL